MSSLEMMNHAWEHGPSELQLEPPRESIGWPYASWRFLHAWKQAERVGEELGLDHAVLLRQFLRWHGQYIFPPTGTLPNSLGRCLAMVGITFHGGVLEAEPFAPSWLQEKKVVLDQPPEDRRVDERIPGERYLCSLGVGKPLTKDEAEKALQNPPKWLSPAQKESAWTALTAPPRSTTLLALPTGSGKSLCFQLLTRFGSGLTVVVVPTVALAIDQHRSACERFGADSPVNPQYFAADAGQDHVAAVIDAIKQRRTRLVFTSPEACVWGRLRAVLEEQAKANLLQYLVIDEAHMIETWGMFFRVDFQYLAELRAKWLESPNCALRTILLSATVTPNTTKILRQLYGGKDVTWQEFVAQRLRPEMTYFVRKFRTPSELHHKEREVQEESQRRTAVAQCAQHLPRPAIIYTTEVEAANNLATHLRDALGFKRLGVFTGDTGPGERRDLLRKWREDEIDLMVATSAFGLGVDKPDVRTVVHACLPENLHRYYQEVGRGGRDGGSAVCVLLSTSRDDRIAEGLGVKLLAEEIMQPRWEALLASGKHNALDDTWELRTDARHVGLAARRTGEQNVDWNRRLILQFVRAGRMDVLDMRYDQGDEQAEPVEWLKVRLGFPGADGNVMRFVEKQRADEIAAGQKGLQYMREHLQGERCVNRRLCEVYDVADAGFACGGCPGCRRSGNSSFPRPTPVEPTSVTKPCLVVVSGCPDFLHQSPIASKQQLLAMNKRGFRRFLCLPEHRLRLAKIFDASFPQDSDAKYRLDEVKVVEDGRAFFYVGQRRDPDARITLRIGPAERVIVFHFGELHRALGGLHGGGEVVHLVPASAAGAPASGYAFLEREGARHLSFDQWTKEA